MKLLQGIRTVLLAGFLTVAGASGALAEYTSWQDTEYDFSQVKTVYLSEMDLSGYGLESGTKAQKMLQEYRKKAGKVKFPKVVMEPAAQVRALLPGEGKTKASLPAPGTGEKPGNRKQRSLSSRRKAGSGRQ